MTKVIESYTLTIDTDSDEGATTFTLGQASGEVSMFDKIDNIALSRDTKATMIGGRYQNIKVAEVIYAWQKDNPGACEKAAVEGVEAPKELTDAVAAAIAQS